MSIATLEARLDVLALAVECIGASLPATQAREVAASFNDRLSLLLAEQGRVLRGDRALHLQHRPLKCDRSCGGAE